MAAIRLLTLCVLIAASGVSSADDGSEQWPQDPASNQKIEKISEAAIGLIFISSE